MIVTGSRTLTDQWIVRAVLTGMYQRSQGSFTVVEGGCLTGADEIARSWAEQHRALPASQVRHESHPADWGKHGKAAGPIRNQEMADEGADLCLAFVDKTLEESKGTADMVRRAKAAGIPTYIIMTGAI